MSCGGGGEGGGGGGRVGVGVGRVSPIVLKCSVRLLS